MANLHQVETGYRLLPIVVAMHARHLTAGLTKGTEFSSVLPTMPEDIAGQTHMCMRNLKEVLDDQGATWRDVVKINRFQKDITESAAIEEVMAQYFDFWDWWPAMTAMEITRLSSEPARLEIELIAVIPRDA